MSSRRVRLTCMLVALALDAGAAHARRHWVGTWTASPASGGDLGLAVANRTIRQFVHASVGGSRLRVRLANTFGAAPLRVDAVTVALADGGVATSIARTVTFGGASAVTIPPGDRIV